MAMDGAGLGLTLLFELSRVAKSMQERNACYREGMAMCDQLDATLRRLMGVAGSIDNIVRSRPATMPHAVLPDFVGTLTSVKDTLVRADSGVTECFSQALIGDNSSGFIDNVIEKGKRLHRARSVKSSLIDIQRDTVEAERKLDHLLTRLCNALKVDDAQLRSDQNMRSLILEHVSPKEAFFPACNVPMLLSNIHLDFETKDADGKFSELEGSLKSCVFRSIGARQGARRSRRVHGVSGMAGVGKTIALIGIGLEDDVLDHFVHGVLYMSLGASATDGHVISELWKIMSVTGATARAEAVKASKSLADAIAIASIWFQGRRVLFLVDDIWPTETCAHGYLPDLEALLYGSPESRMVISTRSIEIATKSGPHVDFGAREACGPTALAIFMAHALPETPPSDHCLEQSRDILVLCSGLPIALSVAGAAVALRINTGDEFEDACQGYIESIQALFLLHPGALFLDSAIRHSLTALSENREKNGYVLYEFTEYSLSELYFSLCVFGSQQFAPMSVLARMWNVSDTVADNICVSFSSMSLGKISRQKLDGRNQRGLNVHDLHLDFIRGNARKTKVEKEWHRRLLNGHIAPDVSVNESMTIDDGNDLRGFNILEYKPRPWWKEDIPNKDYIRKNVSRHLRSAGLELELGATVLDLHWVAAQGTTGGVISMKHDLDVLKTTIEESVHIAGADEPLQSVSIISNSIWLMASEFQNGIRVLNTFSHVLLAGLSDSYEWIRRFLERMRQLTPKPFVMPTIVSYRHPVEDIRWEIDLNLPEQKSFSYLSTDFSSCQKYCAVAANCEVVVYSLENRSRLLRLKRHEQNVSVVKFNSDASRLISASFDKRVIIWNWKDNEAAPLVLRGHRGAVSSLAVSGDNSRVFSGSDDGKVRVWDAATGDFVREMSYGTAVECLACSPTGGLVAVGTRDGFLRCTNAKSGKGVFQYRVRDDAPLSAVQFGPDGRELISGTSQGNATHWSTSNWKMYSTVSVPGSVTHISFQPDGESALLGSSQGEVRHWRLFDQYLSPYKLSVGRSVSGVSFHKSEGDIIVAVKTGYARVWRGPLSSPSLDFSAFRNGIMLDFDISFDGTRVAASTVDGMIRLWNPDTGAQIAAYCAPVDGCRCLGLSVDGTTIASASPNGTIFVWSSNAPPCDTDISFRPGSGIVSCLSFSPDGSRLLVCLNHTIEIWKLETRAEKMGQVPNDGSLDASFSADGRFIIIGNTKRTSIWDAAGEQKIFDSGESVAEGLSLVEAKQYIRTCGPSAHRLWPSSFITKEADTLPHDATSLTVDNYSTFVSNQVRPSHMKFSDHVLVSNAMGQLSIFKFCK